MKRLLILAAFLCFALPARAQVYPPPPVNTKNVAPNTNAIYASPNCGTQTNCVFVHDDMQAVTDATFTNTSETITTGSSDPAFVAGDVGKIEWGVIQTTAGYNYGVLRVPFGTITAVGGAHTITVSIAATASGTGTFAWGDDDTTDLGNVWTAAMAGPCSVQLPAGNAQGTGPAIMPTSKGQFNTISTYCKSLQNNGLVDSGSIVSGNGRGTAIIAFEPDFDFTTCNANSACFGGWSGAIGQFRGWSLSGFGNDLSVGSACPSSPEYMIILTNFFHLIDMQLIGFGSSCTNLTAVRTDGGFQVIRDVVDDGFGGIAGFDCATGNGQPCIYDHVTSQDQLATGGHNLLVEGSGSVADMSKSLFGPTASSGTTAILVSSGGTLNSSQDGFVVSAVGANGVQVRGIAHLSQDNWTDTTSGSSGLRAFDGGTIYMRDTIVGGGSYGLECDSNTGGVNTFVDLGGNTFSGSQSINAQCILTGSANSANSVGVTAAKLVLSAGWGSTAAWTSLSGGDFPIQGTITNSGTGQGASPTITYTFPTPLPVAPYSCTAVDASGTNTLGTFTTSSLTATGVVFTFSLTPTLSDTEVFQITGCSTP